MKEQILNFLLSTTVIGLLLEVICFFTNIVGVAIGLGIVLISYGLGWTVDKLMKDKI